MRFEVKTGGMVAILVGIALLSGSVFLLGLLAGYDIGRETQTSAAQVATDYTLASSPATGASTPVAEASVAPPQENETARSTTTKTNTVTSATVASTAAPKATKAVVVAIPPSPVPKEEKFPSEESEPAVASPAPTPQPKLASNPTPLPRETRRKPFKIQIQAAMDGTSASQMIKRLQILGYQPHAVPTKINGQTWYKVEVGPYATKAEAAAAEAELRQKYDAMFAHPSAPPRPAPPAGSEDE